MTEYTPSLAQLRLAWVDYCNYNPRVAVAEFERAIAAVRTSPDSRTEKRPS